MEQNKDNTELELSKMLLNPSQSLGPRALSVPLPASETNFPERTKTYSIFRSPTKPPTVEPSSRLVVEPSPRFLLEPEMLQESIIKFIQFGCWNQKFCGDNGNPVSLVAAKVKEAISSDQQIKYLIVSGDNYYPIKNKVINLNENPEEREIEDLKIEPKIINKKLLESGFNCLPDIPIYLLWGNHDLDNNNALRIYNTVIGETPDVKKIEMLTNQSQLTAPRNCEILQSELEYLSTKSNIKVPDPRINLVTTRYDESTNTIVLMIDTTMYDITDKDKNNNLICYKQYYANSNLTVTTLISMQEAQIDEIIRDTIIPNQLIKNIIIVGHHPLLYIKNKKGKDKIEDLSKMFGMLYNKINVPLKSSGRIVDYFYLCSDYHNYQKGRVEIVGSAGNMLINQYIVGTGGTKLDDPLVDNSPRAIELKPKGNPTAIAIYNFEEDMNSHGFLECSMKMQGAPNFNFTPVQIRGGFRKNRSLKKRKPIKKSVKKSKNKRNRKKTIKK